MASAEFHLNNQNSLGKRMSFNAIIPDSGDGPFPVLYLLHGLSDNHLTWSKLSGIERYVGGLPLIVVMPDGERGFYCDNSSRPYANYETYIVEEVVGFVDQTLNTIPTAAGRVTAGLSMGGYGAAKFALKFPEKFSAAASLSGALQFAHTSKADDIFIDEFAPVVGSIVPGGPHDLHVLAESLKPDQRPPLFISCGSEDFLIEQNRDFDRFLTSLGFGHHYEEHPGVHNWEYWNKHILFALEFLLPRIGIIGFEPKNFL